MCTTRIVTQVYCTTTKKKKKIKIYVAVRSTQQEKLEADISRQVKARCTFRTSRTRTHTHGVNKISIPLQLHRCSRESLIPPKQHRNECSWKRIQPINITSSSSEVLLRLDYVAGRRAIPSRCISIKEPGGPSKPPESTSSGPAQISIRKAHYIRSQPLFYQSAQQASQLSIILQFNTKK